MVYDHWSHWTVTDCNIWSLFLPDCSGLWELPVLWEIGLHISDKIMCRPLWCDKIIFGSRYDKVNNYTKIVPIRTRITLTDHVHLHTEWIRLARFSDCQCAYSLSVWEEQTETQLTVCKTCLHAHKETFFFCLHVCRVSGSKTFGHIRFMA